MEESLKDSLKKKKILLVEETPTLISDLGEKLMGRDFDVWTAESLDQLMSFLENGFDSDKEIHIILLRDKKEFNLI